MRAGSESSEVQSDSDADADPDGDTSTPAHHSHTHNRHHRHHRHHHPRHRRQHHRNHDTSPSKSTSPSGPSPYDPSPSSSFSRSSPSSWNGSGHPVAGAEPDAGIVGLHRDFAVGAAAAPVGDGGGRLGLRKSDYSQSPGFDDNGARFYDVTSRHYHSRESLGDPDGDQLHFESSTGGIGSFGAVNAAINDPDRFCFVERATRNAREQSLDSTLELDDLEFAANRRTSYHESGRTSNTATCVTSTTVHTVPAHRNCCCRCLCITRLKSILRTAFFKAFSRANFNYMYAHVAYVILEALFCSLIIFFVEKHTGTIPTGTDAGSTWAFYVDSLFLCMSAATVTGLTTLDFPASTHATQAVACFLMLFGGLGFDSTIPLLLRKFVWKRPQEPKDPKKEKAELQSKDREGDKAGTTAKTTDSETSSNGGKSPDAIKEEDKSDSTKQPATSTTTTSAEFETLNNKFVRNTEAVEDNAVDFLVVLIPLYVASCIILAVICFTIYVYVTDYRTLLKSRNIPLFWFAVFQSISAVNNVGLSLLAEGMMAFYTSPLALIITGLFQLLGQTWLPVLLRLIVVGIYQLKKKFNQDYGTLYYIKHNSRSVTTVIFPKNENRNLLFILLAATGIEWSFLMGLNWNIVGIGCNWFQKVTMTLFQAICSRTTGFNVFDMNLLQPGMLVLTAIMLYMSTYPMTIVMRSTSTTPSFMQTPGGSDSRALYHTKKQMISDILWVVLPFFVICTIEGNKITSDPNFTHFKVLFEVISGYANVGLSLGYPNKPFSFSGTWHTSSKLILTVCMLFGHHRGFPDHIDQAIRPMFNLVNREVSVKEREAPAPHVREDHVSSRHTTFDGTIRRSSRDEEARASRDDDEEKGDAAPPPAQIKPPQMCTNTIPNAPSPPFSENSSQYLGSSQEQLGSPAPIPSPSL